MESAAAQLAGLTDLAALDRARDAFSAELHQQQQALEAERAALAADRRQLEADRATVANLEAKIQQTFAQLDQRAREVVGQQKQLETDRRGLELLRRELAEQQKLLDAAPPPFEVERQRAALRQRLQGLRTKKAEFRKQVKAALTQFEQKEQRALEAIERRTAKLEAAESAVRRRGERQDKRRLKLRKFRQQLSTRMAEVRKQREQLELLTDRARQVVEQRQRLLDLQQLMQDAERRMIRRWGVSRGLGWVFGLIGCVTLITVLTFFISDKLATRIYLASGAVQLAESDAADPAVFLAAQRQRMLTDVNLQQAVSLMRQIGHAGVLQQADIRDHLAAHLQLTTPQAGLIHAEVTGEYPELLKPMLDGVLRAYVADLTLKSGVNPAAARLVQAVAVAREPVSSNRGFIASVVFSVALLLFGGLFAGMTWQLIRTRPLESDIIDESIASAEEWGSLKVEG